MGERYEGGQAPQRIEWVDEGSTEGTTPSNPAWNLFSDNVVTWFDGTPDANTTPQRGAGDVDPVGFFNGAETHEFSFEYDLNQWFVDGSGNLQDAAYAAMDRTSDNAIKETHTVVAREEHNTGGADSGGRRIYTVGKGGHPGTATIPFETEEGTPVRITLDYQFEKVRIYDISQPSSSTTLGVESTDSGDTSQTATIENEGAGTTETFSLNGTTFVTGSNSFGDIDAIELDAETTGDVKVSINNSGSAGTTLATIKGTGSYDVSEGDLGVPALGTGSHASAFNSSYVIFNDDTLDYSGTAIAAEIISGEAEIDQGLDDNSQDGTQKRDIFATNRTTTVTASVADEKATFDQVMDHLQNAENTIKWTADEGNITFDNAHIMDPGDMTKEAGQAKIQLDVEWEAKGLTVS